MSNITNCLNKIKTAIYGKDVRGAIHDAIKQVYDDASVNHDNANMEVKMARGTHNTLNDRLENADEIQAQTNSQLAKIISSYQPKNDNSLNTNDKSVIGAINELETMTGGFWSNEKCTVKTENGDGKQTSYRFPNGLQINIMQVWGTWDITTAWGSVWSSPHITPSNYIQSFLIPPQVTITAHGAGTAIMLSQAGGPTTTMPGTYYLWKPVQQTGVKDYIEIISIGRWK